MTDLIDVKYIQKTLKKNLGVDLYDLFKECNVMLVGGALTSILTNKEINDFDCYFKQKKDIDKFLFSVGGDAIGFACRFICITDKSITFKYNETKIQLIHQSYYNDVLEVFSDFDFTVNMIGYDFENENISLDCKALQHLSQRVLSVNTNTKFPLISVLRVNKYLERGYTISKKEMFKLLLSVNKLNLESYDEVVKNLGGMYGISISEVFNQDKEFSIEEVIEQLSEYDFDNMKPYTCVDYYDFRDEFVFGDHIDLLKALPFFKGVLHKDGIYFSEWDKDFEYKTGEKAVPILTDYVYGGGGIYASHKPDGCYKGDTLISLTPEYFEEFDHSCFKGGVLFKHIVCHDYEKRDNLTKYVLDYLEAFEYITQQQRDIVEVYYNSNFNLYDYVCKKRMVGA